LKLSSNRKLIFNSTFFVGVVGAIPQGLAYAKHVLYN
jgi:hypothetical protein